MRDYEGLVERLREADEKSMCGECGMNLHSGTTKKGVLFAESADAIEELVSNADKFKWISVEERLPESGTHVLVCCRVKWLVGGGHSYVCDAFHSDPKTIPCSYSDDIDMEYDEKTDEYYFPEGWWEVIKNWDEYACVAIADLVTYWMPLPEPPTTTE